MLFVSFWGHLMVKPDTLIITCFHTTYHLFNRTFPPTILPFTFPWEYVHFIGSIVFCLIWCHYHETCVLFNYVRGLDRGMWKQALGRLLVFWETIIFNKLINKYLSDSHVSKTAVGAVEMKNMSQAFKVHTILAPISPPRLPLVTLLSCTLCFILPLTPFSEHTMHSALLMTLKSYSQSPKWLFFCV